MNDTDTSDDEPQIIDAIGFKINCLIRRYLTRKTFSRSMFLRLIRLKLLIVILLLWVSSVQAQGSEKERISTAHSIHKGSTFQTLYLDFFYSEKPDRKISVINLNKEWGYYILKPLSLIGGYHVLHTSGYRLKRDEPGWMKVDASVMGLGLAGTVRFDLVSINRFGVFIDAGLGFLICSDEFPPGGTFWNFTQRYTVGVSVRFSKNMKLLLAGRHLHVSNGGYYRNPSYDGKGPFVGVMYGF